MGFYDKSEQLPVSRDKLSRLRLEPIRPLGLKLFTFETSNVFLYASTMYNNYVHGGFSDKSELAIIPLK
jgi:hypothetical protein